MKKIITTQEIYKIFEEQFNLSKENMEDSFLESYVLGADEFIDYGNKDEVALFERVLTKEGLYMTHQLLINDRDLYVVIANEENTKALCYFHLNMSTDEYTVKFP